MLFRILYNSNLYYIKLVIIKARIIINYNTKYNIIAISIIVIKVNYTLYLIL